MCPSLAEEEFQIKSFSMFGINLLSLKNEKIYCINMFYQYVNILMKQQT